jgi:hypothetical protein
MTQRTLADLKEALQQPFAPENIQFLPKEIHQENGKYVCLALPYANKRIYEDRLNELAFGEWSTPYVPPFAQGNKLILPVTVVILGVAHTDYGEEYFLTTGKGGNTREDDNTATEAYSQAFRRACAQFLLGRYLYDLPKRKLPYDPKTHQLAISEAQRIAWVEKLYMEGGLKPRSYSTSQRPGVPDVLPEPQADPTTSDEPQAAKGGTTSTQPVVSSAAPAAQQKTATTTIPAKGAPVQQKTSTLLVPPQKAPQQSEVTASAPKPQTASSVAKEAKPITQPTAYQDTFLDWVARKVERDPERIQGICTRYRVQNLAQLSSQQRTNLTQRLKQQARKPQQQPASAASV